MTKKKIKGTFGATQQMNPLSTTTEDCKNKHFDYQVISPDGYTDYHSDKCELCQGKGKTTKLIFKIEDFECNGCKNKGKSIGTYSCNCKLPKKGLWEFRKDDLHGKNCQLVKFHLTSDVEVKSAKEVLDLQEDIHLYNQYNLSRHSKLIIVRGYYE